MSAAPSRYVEQQQRTQSSNAYAAASFKDTRSGAHMTAKNILLVREICRKSFHKREVLTLPKHAPAMLMAVENGRFGPWFEPDRERFWRQASHA
eukprot:1979873-Amphidinium_carterae.1